MSQWTHVCGCIRIDTTDHEETNKKISEIFGKTIYWESSMEEWDKQEKNPELFTPTGTEGGIKYDIWENPKLPHLASFTVSIFGDLRDYQDSEEIINWINKIYNNFFIRDLIVSIEVEYQERIIVAYDGYKKPLKITRRKWKD